MNDRHDSKSSFFIMEEVAYLVFRKGVDMKHMQDSLVGALDAAGVAVSAVSLTNLAETARRIGVVPALVDVLVDEDAPMCARVRAFGRVSSQVFATSNEVFGAVLDRGAVELAA